MSPTVPLYGDHILTLVRPLLHDSLSFTAIDLLRLKDDIPVDGVEGAPALIENVAA